MAEASLTIRDYSLGKIQAQPTEIRAEGGPEYPRLIIPARLELVSVKPPYRAEPFFVILNVQSCLYIESDPLKFADSVTISAPLEFANIETSHTYQIEFPLDIHRLKRIEEARRGDLRLRLDFRFMIGLYQSLTLLNNGQPVTHRFLQGFERQGTPPMVELTIPQSHWINRVLPALGLGKYLILEIPQDIGAIPEAWGYLEQAELAFKNWNSKEISANCREIGTLLDTQVKAKFGATSFSYKEKWGRAYGKFSDLASIDLHLEDLKKSAYPPESIKTNKADAEHLILRAKVLIKYAGDLLKE